MWSLLNLVATGSLGPVAPGSPSEAVIEAFGAPTDATTGRPPIILKYDALEVSVSDGQIDLLHVEFHEPLPPFLDDAGLGQRSTRAEVEKLLADWGISCQPHQLLTIDDDQSALIASGRVILVFGDDNRLAAISSSQSA